MGQVDQQATLALFVAMCMCAGRELLNRMAELVKRHPDRTSGKKGGAAGSSSGAAAAAGGSKQSGKKSGKKKK